MNIKNDMPKDSYSLNITHDGAVELVKTYPNGESHVESDTEPNAVMADVNAMMNRYNMYYRFLPQLNETLVWGVYNEIARLVATTFDYNSRSDTDTENTVTVTLDGDDTYDINLDALYATAHDPQGLSGLELHSTNTCTVVSLERSFLDGTVDAYEIGRYAGAKMVKVIEHVAGRESLLLTMLPDASDVEHGEDNGNSRVVRADHADEAGLKYGPWDDRSTRSSVVKYLDKLHEDDGYITIDVTVRV